MTDSASCDLSPLRVEDADELFPLLQDDRIYEYLDQPAPDSLENLRDRHAFMLDPGSSPPGELWLNWLVNVGEDRSSAGTVQATVDVESNTAEIAYVLSPTFWGLGIASAAVRLMLVELAEKHGVQTFVASIDPRNARSLALATRLGFVATARPQDDTTNKLADGDVIMQRRSAP